MTSCSSIIRLKLRLQIPPLAAYKPTRTAAAPAASTPRVPLAFARVCFGRGWAAVLVLRWADAVRLIDLASTHFHL